jgi:hypothetical protein
VNDTEFPEQIVVLGDGEMLIVGTTGGVTVMVVVEEFTVAGFAQFAFEVNLQ